MFERGVYPAAVTPFDEKGRVDLLGVAKLAAWFESCGCKGVVLAGTNGEGPSLSAPEKRDLAVGAQPLLGKLKCIVGIATPSLTEAVWSTQQAHKAGAHGLLVMPPYYFKPVAEVDLRDWFLRVLDSCAAPVLLYNFPQKTGIKLEAQLLSELSSHPNFAGAKDSSGTIDNLIEFRQALPNHDLFVGDETLLIDALQAGWTGTISGAANIVGSWLVEIIRDWDNGNSDSAKTKFEILKPCLRMIRQGPQPALNKGILAARGVIDRADVRLPLTSAGESSLRAFEEMMAAQLGTRVKRS